MASSEAVANYFIQKSFNEGVSLTPMKLIKLVYIAHGWHRGYFHKNLIDDGVQAWRYGPVIPELYRNIRRYGRNNVTGFIDGYGIIGDQANPAPDENSLALLEHVWKTYSRYDGLQLSAMTHQRNTPWDITWRDCDGNSYAQPIISNELIERHYREKIQASKQNA
ncbi:Panacea domain-containing protein [Stutzerimonas kunmingensis]|uniref:Panacea domain-containing protein n=1 Tax=Stutzerimonas kunmingensis TaxID=1211807 RepID=UPI001F22B271|nr:type II toxin-antitoxin system antitoxin SocA domain-containing protein [Stutzerimonas kunmingensis]UIP32589.1 DUF4065 domain-containing protein [Stutzerimonas kunmingensis]